MLEGTPYLLTGETGLKSATIARQLADKVELFRKSGKLTQSALERLRQEWRVPQVYESAGIEGNTLTLQETRLVLERGITITNKPAKDSAEARRLAAALDYLEALVHDMSQPLREVNIREIHRLVEGDAGGTYRTTEVEISGAPHRPPLPTEVPAQMGAYAAWLQGVEANPLPALVASVAHTWLVHIHPFADGNGRTARAAMNLVLMRKGYPIVLIRRKDRPRYYEALAASDQGDLSLMLELVCERADDSLAELDRIRAAVTGVSLAGEKLRAAAERRWSTWTDAARLVRSTLAQLVAAEGSSLPVHATVKPMGDLDFDDYNLLSQRETRGNTWFTKIAGHGLGKTAELLLWIGYCSDTLKAGASLSRQEPSIWVSEHDRGGLKPYRLIPDGSPFTFREFTFDGEKYWVRRNKDGRELVESVRTAHEVASWILRDFLTGYFA
jgi:Fic family protein